MELSRQENVSRQSSILKLPKQRQPLQCVATNPSSSENSPTVKIKRRVSFAKNRRIREFCNEAEPESVWDDTYEEHDLSSIKSNCSNTNEHPVIISVPCDDKENFPVQIFLHNDQLECKDIRVDHPGKEEENLLRNNEEIDTTRVSIDPKNIGTQNDEEDEPISTIFYNDVMDVTSNLSINIVPCNNQGPNSFTDTVPILHNCTQSTSMEITENLPLTLCRNSIQGFDTKKELDNNTNKSTEVTSSSLLGAGGLNKSMNSIELTNTNLNLEFYQTKANCSSSVQMEFSSILPSSTWIKSTKNNKKSETNDQVLQFSTNAVHINSNNNQNIEKSTDLSENIKNISNKFIETLEAEHGNNIQSNSIQEEINVFSDKSMEITGMVPIRNVTHEANAKSEKLLPEVLKNNTNNSLHEFVGILDAVPNYRNHQYGAGVYQVTDEKMKEASNVFSNISMELSKKFPIYETNHQSDTKAEKLTHEILQDQTKMFTNKSMEITEIVPTYKYHEPNISAVKVMHDKMQEKTKYFDNKSMEISETFHLYKQNYQSPANLELPAHKVAQEKTKIFSNNSMELSETIQLHKLFHESINEVIKISDEMAQKKTKTFVENSIETTEVASVSKKIGQSNTNARETHETIQNNNEFNEPWKTIKTVPVCNKNHQDNANVNTLHNEMQEKTKIFVNNSMEITETVPICNMIHKSPTNTKMITHKNTEEETKLFSNKSMEMTEAISTNKEMHQFNNKIREIPHELIEDKTKYFKNKSMEMTETALIDFNTYQTNTHVRNKLNNTVEENTNIFLNNSMELTEAVPAYNRIYQTDNNTNKIRRKSTRRSKTFYEKSIEPNDSFPIYNVVHSDANTVGNLQDLLQERMSIICNTSMENTVSSSFPTHIQQTITTPKTLSSNVITETFPVCTQIHKNILTPPEKALTDKNKKIPNKVPEKNLKIMMNKSLDTHNALTTTDQSCSVLKKISDQSVHEKIEEFTKSMDVSKTVYPINSKANTETSSMEKNISSLNKISSKTSILTDDKKSRFFSDKSMSIDETVPICQNMLSNLDIQKFSKNMKQDNLVTYFKKPIDVTENFQTHQQIPAFDLSNQAILNESEDEKTKIFLNKSMDMTETIAVGKGNQYLQNKNTNTKYIQTTMTNAYDNTSEGMTFELPICSSESKNDENKKSAGMLDTVSRNVHYPNDKFNSLLNTTEMSSELQANKINNINNINNKHTSYHQPLPDSIEVFHDNSMDDTLGCTILSSSINNLTKMNEYPNQNILSNKIDTISNSMNVSKSFNKNSHYKASNRFKNGEESFRRITSDELNTLCASMNLPAQRYSRIENTQHDYIPLYNDAKASLKGDEIFQRKSVYSERNESLNNCVKTCGNFVKKNDFTIFCDADNKEPNLIQSEKHETENILAKADLPVMQKNPVAKCLITENDFDICSTRTNPSLKLTTNPIDQMETDKTVEMILKYPKYQQSCGSVSVYHDDSIEINENLRSSIKSVTRDNLSDSVYNVHSSTKLCNNLNDNNNETNREISRMVINEQSINRMPIDRINDIHYDMSLSKIATCPVSDTAQMHKSIIVSDQNAKTSNNTVNTCTDVQKNTHDNFTTTEKEKFLNNKIKIYHDISMELTSDSSNANKKFKKISEFSTNKTNMTSNITGIIDSSMVIYHDPVEDKNDVISREQNLSRIPSDNTDILLATMGFKTELSHPLIINDKTTIKVLNKPLPSKISSNTNENNEIEANKPSDIKLKTYEQNKNMSSCLIKYNGDNEEANVIENNYEINDTDKNSYLDKENKEPRIRANLFPENHSQELDEIEPPSFLCSNSFQDDSVEHIAVLNNDYLNQENITEELATHSSNDLNSLSKEIQSKTNKESRSKGCDNEQINKLMICEKKEETLTPILLLIQDIKKHEKRDDCIWSIRAVNQKLIAIDFITKSFVVIIRLNEWEKVCNKDIKDVQIISRISANSKNILFKTIHNLLLLKLKPNIMSEKYKMYEHVLPLLEYISSEVIFAMNFMFDLKQIKASHVLNIDKERIIFMVASKKANIILKISLVIKIFSEIGPDDIDVTCVLGDIRKSDIMQLIINIKRDYKFLRRYINDIKDYITLMEESTYFNK